ncbi:WD40 repeat-like protein [Neolentinus lepideus HHB14362 ss-1]|uniref:WD40 repeat-like protein n=1 Tax=Neolentinus lepideus HHB14362 ss-1 TaxID=1314782 RepID=A0A165W7Y3_9AGAM|nr:WD40 repeat-like protein [Neolentinus lepideus HHB14362 ss-1]
MAATKAKNSATGRTRQPNTSPAKVSRTPKSRKGKAKEDIGPAKNAEAWKNTVELGEDVTWSWTSLSDSWASRHAPVFTKDGSYFFSVVGSSVKIYSSVNGQVVSTLSASPSGSSACKYSGGDGHTDVITSAILSPNNPYQLITASLDGCIKVWDFLEADLLQTIDLGQPILHLCAHGNFQEFVFVAVARPGKKKKADGGSKDDNAAVLRVSLKPRPATAGDSRQKSSEITAVGKTRSTCGLALSPSGQWLVAVAGHKAYVAQTSSLKSGFTKFVSPEALTCLAFHPSEEYFATGDVRGNIRLWYCLNEDIIRSQSAVGVEKKAQTTTLHWHAHAVSSLAFTLNGAYLLSGGEESVLVIWQLHTGKKEFVPRVSSPIFTIAVYRTKEHEEGYLLGLADASFVVIDAGSLKITKSFSRIKLDSSLSSGGQLPPASAPLAYHNQSASLMLPSSHPSSLQAYSPSQHQILLELEVSPSNRVSRRDEKRIEPSRVLSIAIARTGVWMATLDNRDGDDTFHREIYLKLWHWNARTAAWSLNTRIDRPHGEAMVNTVVFSPDTSRPLLVTAGDDGKVKVWDTRTNTGKNGEREEFWVARSSFHYRSELPKHASWSPDGSLLVISFGAYVVLYDPTTCLVHCVLSSSHCKSASSAHFLGTEGRYLAVVGTYDVLIWNLITRTVQWHRRCPAAISTVIPHSIDETLAVFHNSSGQEDASSVGVYHATSRTPVKVRSLPFRLLSITSYPSHPSSSRNLPFTLVGITTAWNVVMLGDYLPPREEGATDAQAIAGRIEVGTRRTLFQDIFGKSAFTDHSNKQSQPLSSDQSYTWNNNLKTGMLEGPSHLLPPIETMFDSLMAGYLQPRLPPHTEEDEQDDSRDDMEEDVDVNMNLPGTMTPVILGSRADRVVSYQEMDMFVELFKQHAVTRRNSSLGLINGHKINGSHVHSNGHVASVNLPEPRHRVNGHQPTPVKSSIQATVPANGVVEEVSTSATAGKKRKKSLA